jgi:signal transduction histidine kinase
VKRKIVLGLALFTVVFLLSGAWIANRIRSATGELDRLISLHQVEILREHFLLQIRRVQSDLLLKDTQHAASPESVLANVGEVRETLGTCFGCHHSQEATTRLEGLRHDAQEYQEALDLALAAGGRSPGAVEEREAAFMVGERLGAHVREMIDHTAAALERNTHRALQAIERTKYVLYALLGVGPILAALLGYAFISGLTRPLGVLLESTRRLERGELDHRVTGLQDEFGHLEVSFNKMAGSLKDQLNRMQRAEQMAVAGQLAAGLAHEIRNPLGGIKAAMQVLSAEGHFPETDRRVLRNVIREVAHVESLMTQFLSFTRPAKPQLVELNVNDAVEMTLAFYAMSQAQPPDRPTPVRIVTDLRPVPDTLADPVQLQQVLLNLILNAVDAMPSGGQLEVRTRLGDQPDFVDIAVSDTGRGISQENARRLFQPFFTTKPKGTGLGLATSKQLIEQHGGSISVAPNPGGGTIFRVHLPLPAAGAAAS